MLTGVGGQVDSPRERRRRAEEFDVTVRERRFDDVSITSEHSGVVHPNDEHNQNDGMNEMQSQGTHQTSELSHPKEWQCLW